MKKRIDEGKITEWVGQSISIVTRFFGKYTKMKTGLVEFNFL